MCDRIVLDALCTRQGLDCSRCTLHLGVKKKKKKFLFAAFLNGLSFLFFKNVIFKYPSIIHPSAQESTLFHKKKSNVKIYNFSS